MEQQSRRYLPAAGHDFALPLYDPLTKLFGAERARRALLRQAALRAGQRVLDVGCGTGSLVLMAKQTCPGAELTGLDPDAKALRRSVAKARRAGVDVRFDRGFADELPYEDAAFDRVLSSFMLHHLPEGEKPAMLREVRRVLKPGGSLHLVDLATPEHGAHGLAQRLWKHHGASNPNRGVLALLREAGFDEVSELDRGKMLLQDIVYYRARVA